MNNDNQCYLCYIIYCMGVAHAVKELNSFFEKKFTKRRPGKPTISIVGGVNGTWP